MDYDMATTNLRIKNKKLEEILKEFKDSYEENGNYVTIGFLDDYYDEICEVLS